MASAVFPPLLAAACLTALLYLGTSCAQREVLSIPSPLFKVNIQSSFFLPKKPCREFHPKSQSDLSSWLAAIAYNEGIINFCFRGIEDQDMDTA